MSRPVSSKPTKSEFDARRAHVFTNMAEMKRDEEKKMAPIEASVYLEPKGEHKPWRFYDMIIESSDDHAAILNKIIHEIEKHHYTWSTNWDIVMAIRWKDFRVDGDLNLTSPLLSLFTKETLHCLLKDAEAYGEKKKGDGTVYLGVTYAERE
jgi:hypothetical protein